MKLLVCIDGSEQSQKAVDKALEIAGGCSVDKVTLINVYEKEGDFSETGHDRISLTQDDLKMLKELKEKEREDRKKMLADDAKHFKDNNIEATTVVECGHPAESITRVASEGDYDMIIIGSRGLGGLKKFLLGSVSNSVLQEAKCSVLVVK